MRIGNTIEGGIRFTPADSLVSHDKLFDVSYATTPEELALLQQAGQKVGLRVSQVTIVDPPPVN